MTEQVIKGWVTDYNWRKRNKEDINVLKEKSWWVPANYEHLHSVTILPTEKVKELINILQHKSFSFSKVLIPRAIAILEGKEGK